MHKHRSHENRTHVPELMGRVDYFMSGDCPGTYQIYEGRREELEGDGEGMPGLN